MPMARHGDVELFYETFGGRRDPTLLLVNGLGSQCIDYAEAWCERFAVEGFQVVRFDNRDVGLSSKLDHVRYSLADMAADGLAVLDALGVERAHVMGVSMGGGIVQRFAIDHPARLLTMTSAMSTTGEDGYGLATPDALAMLRAEPATSREEYIEMQVKSVAAYGSAPGWTDETDTRTRAAAAYDRCFYPKGRARQLKATLADGSRTDALRNVRTPTLVLHGSRDAIIDPSGGRRTAEVMPNARYVEIEGLGHDYPPSVWDRWVTTWSDFVREALSAGHL